MNAEQIINRGPVPVILKRDTAGNPVVFLKDTLNMSDDNVPTVEVWHIGGGQNTNVVPKTYYDTCKPLEHEEMLTLANKFADEYKPKYGLAVKSRLGKDLSSHHTANPSKNANESIKTTETQNGNIVNEQVFNKQEFVEKLIVAFANALREAIKE